MNDLKKLTIILIRLQATGFLLLAIIHWGIIAAGILVASFKTAPTQQLNFEFYLTVGILYLIVGLILWARSKSLADYFIRSVQDNQEPTI